MIVLLSVFLPFQLLGQTNEKTYPFYIKTIYASGHITEHSKDVSNMSRGFTQGVDMIFDNLIRINTTMKDRNSTVLMDLGFHYIKYPYDYLGECFGVTMGKSGRIFDYKKFQMFGQFTMGVGYDTNPFSQTNNKNLGISTHLGFIAHFDLSATYTIYKNLNLLAGIGYNHLSNGSIKRPNLGLNVLSTNLGVAYFIKEKTIETPENLEYHGRKYFYHLIGTYFPTSNLSYDGDNYPAYNLHAQVERYLSVHHSLLFSVDYTCDTKLQYPEQKDPNDTNNNNYNYLGISLGGNWKFSIFDADLTIGAYLLRPWHETRIQYSLIHFKAYVTKNVYFLVGLKAHTVQADVFETGIGFKI